MPATDPRPIAQRFSEWAVARLGVGPATTRTLYETAPRAWSLDTMDVERILRDEPKLESQRIGGATVWRLRTAR